MKFNSNLNKKIQLYLSTRNENMGVLPGTRGTGILPNVSGTGI